jgi:hypothetical protein
MDKALTTLNTANNVLNQVNRTAHLVHDISRTAKRTYAEMKETDQRPQKQSVHGADSVHYSGPYIRPSDKKILYNKFDGPPGPWQRKIHISGKVETSSTNITNYATYDLMTRTELLAHMNDEFKMIGQDNAGTGRVETYSTSITTPYSATMFGIQIDAKIKLKCKNNYNYPVNIICYYVSPRTNTGNSFNTTMINGFDNRFNDQTFSNNNHPLLFPEDSIILLKQYRIDKKKHVVLLPGEGTVFQIYSKFTTNFGYVNDEALEYNKYWYKGIVIRQVGDVAHDDVNVGLSSTSLDVVEERIVNFRFKNQPQIPYWYETNTLGTMTTTNIVNPRATDKETSK